MKLTRSLARKKRHKRSKRKVRGITDRPRLSVYKSNKHVYAQLIDDTIGNTLVSASTIDKALKDNIKAGCNIDNASKVGELIAKRAIQKGIEKIVFDRSGYLYHGRVKALADAAREAGLKF